MTDPDQPPAIDGQAPQRQMPPPAVHIRQRRFSFVWIIPLIAAAIAVYLGYRTLVEQGPLVTITFNNSEGLAVGQTQVKYKWVALGTLESIDLSPDNSHVVVKVRMNNVGTRFLTTHARFWVVRPRLSVTNLSGLDTLVSGSYIGIDPGAPGGRYDTHFTGLEEPPGVRSDEPGSTYVLHADSVGSLSSGSPVFYRDVVVGEVLGYDLGDGIGPVTINIFVRAPYNKLVKPSSHFWDSSGISIGVQGGTLRVQVQSLEAVLAGGVTFDLPSGDADMAPSPDNAPFRLYPTEEDAEAAGYLHQIPAVAYFQSSVAGIGPGTPVTIFGIQVGYVTAVRFMLDPQTGLAKVRVAMQLQPDRVVRSADFNPNIKPRDVLQRMVDRGMRVDLETSSFITGQKDVSLTIEPGAGHVPLTFEGQAIVLPTAAGAGSDLFTAASQITAKLSSIPFDQIGANLNKLLVTSNNTLGGVQVKNALASLSQTLQSVQHLVATTDRGLEPTLRALPTLTANLESTLRGTDQAVRELNRGYGNNSDFQRSLGQLMDQADGALRSVKDLADFLDRHPESLLMGRTGRATGGE
jgi:paraquat-inducible protein B